MQVITIDLYLGWKGWWISRTIYQEAPPPPPSPHRLPGDNPKVLDAHRRDFWDGPYDTPQDALQAFQNELQRLEDGPKEEKDGQG